MVTFLSLCACFGLRLYVYLMCLSEGTRQSTTGTLILTVVFLILDFPFVAFLGSRTFLTCKGSAWSTSFGCRERTKSGDCSPASSYVGSANIKPPVFGIIPLTALTGFFPRDASGGGRYISFDGGLKLICLYCPLRHKWAFFIPVTTSGFGVGRLSSTIREEPNIAMGHGVSIMNEQRQQQQQTITKRR